MIVTRKGSSQSGQTAIFFTLTLIPVFGLLGLVVDVGWSYWRREACRSAAQSAAIAAAMAANAKSSLTCTSQVPCQSTYSACPSSLTTPSDPIQAGCLYAQANGFTNGASSGRVSVKAAAYTGTTSIPVSGVTPGYWISFTVSERIPTTWSAVLGQANMTVTGQATAAVMGGSGGGCIYVMKTSGTDVTMSGGAVSSNCGVYVNSNGSSALLMSGGTITTTGGAKTTVATGGACLGGGCSGISPSYVSGPVQADPLASMAVPSYASMGSAYTSCQDILPVVVALGSRTLTPGLYCNGITISGGSVTLNSGLYVFRAGINMSGGSISSASGGVMIYEESGGINISGGTINLSAQSTGTYKGILIFQSRTNSSGINMSGGTQTYSGAVYSLAATLTMSGGNYNNTLYVCNALTVSGGGTATMNGTANTAYTGTTVSFIG
jgi:hypothetical protein